MVEEDMDLEQLFKYLSKIVRMFNCENCGNCCRHNPIYLLPKDFERIKETHSNIYQMLDRSKMNEYIIRNPCGYLNSSNKCSIYADRPTFCEIYPFSFSHPYGGIAVYPCPIGIKISKELDKFKMYSINGKKPINYVSEGSNTYNQIREQIEDSNVLREMLEGKSKGEEKIEIRIISPRVIKPFYKYLKSHRE